MLCDTEELKMITIGIITVSDRSSKGEREDLSGPVIRDWAIWGNRRTSGRVLGVLGPDLR